MGEIQKAEKSLETLGKNLPEFFARRWGKGRCNCSQRKAAEVTQPSLKSFEPDRRQEFSRFESVARTRCEVMFEVVMSEAAIPLEVQQFVNRYIFSVEQLEILLTLSANPERFWSVSDVFQSIKSNEKSIAERLEMFRHDGLVIETEGKYRFAAESADVTELVSKLAVVYRERSVAVIELIYKDPARQMRHFAEAFKFRKEK